MGMAEHYHPHLRIVANGDDVPVPANIGVDVTSGAMSALHTHESDGTIHIKADTKGEVFTLGQLFTQWGVSLGVDHVGGGRGQDKIEVTINGEPYTGTPMDLELAPDQKIVLRVS